jgi:O-antigen/teichoic acid export membrane protein
MEQKEHKGAFFRQSGWMVAATTFGGLLMWAVHKVATGCLSEADYGTLGMYLRALNLMMIPACGLQAVFAQQTAIALDPESRSRLSMLVRESVLWTFLLWGAAALGVWFFHTQIEGLFKISGTFLALAVLVGLLILLRPIGVGILQGEQNFCWVGWSQILDGAGRLGVIALVLFLFKGGASGALLGVLSGLLLCIAVCIWKTRPVWSVKGARVDLWDWVIRLAPLTLGAGIPLFMVSADTLVVKAAFDAEEVNLYAAAGIVTQAMIFFTLPVTAVMFPKVARSSAQSEKSSVLLMALGTTGMLSAAVVAGTFLMPELPLRVMFSANYLEAAALLPWFALAMFPLTMSTVLINNLLARGLYAAVPWLWCVAALYLGTLVMKHESFEQVILVIGIYNALLLGVAIFFSFRRSQRSQRG